MGPGGMRGGPPSDPMNDKLKEPLPKSIREVPGYIRRVTKSFFSPISPFQALGRRSSGYCS